MEQLTEKIAALELYVKQLEKMIADPTRKEAQSIEEDMEGFITVYEILREYNICHKTFFTYKKLIPIKKTGKVGRFDRYRKKDVKVFFEKIMNFKNENPSLFPSPFAKAS